jgi:DNA helicase-2/ATP-dependent DNA helicase PcrA
MDSLINKRNKLNDKLKKYQEKIYSIENELIEIEIEISSFDNKEQLNSIELNEQQKTIINSESKNILVIAVPGSGKTHTVINRYINLVTNKNVNPNSVILITFTKKSGQEMLDRINNYVPNKLPFYVGSLHGLGYKMLNKTDYSILDEKDSFDLITECGNHLTDNNYLIKNIPYFYDKLCCTYPQDIDNIMELMDINIKFKSIIIKILKEYHDIKNKNKLLDFNDLMIQFNEFLNKQESEQFKDNIKYVFFDEFQDINSIQYSILNKFNNKSNIMVVGDDAQSIYSFRGSNVNYILNYNSDQTYYLENNYRSTPYIVNFFKDIIGHNQNKLEKNIISSQKEKGMKPIVRFFKQKIEQYDWIAEEIKKNYNNGVKLSEIVILARTNKSLNTMEFSLNKQNINYIKNSGLSILNKESIKMFLAFISLLINENNIISIKKILNLHNIDYDEPNVNLFPNELNIFISQLKQESDIKKPIMIKKYLMKFYKDSKDDLNIICNYFRRSDNIIDCYNDLYLNVDIEENNKDKLLLSTIHGSKGLEWKYVYIIDCNNKSLPSIRPTFFKQEIETYEEERRLFYVACSRAKKYLYLTYSDNISPFIKEINKDYYNIYNENIIQNPKDIKSDLQINGYNKYYNILNKIDIEIEKVNNKIDIDCDTNMYVDTYINLFIKKIIYNKFHKKCKFNINTDEKYKLLLLDPTIDKISKIIKKITDKTIKYNYTNNYSDRLVKYNFSNLNTSLKKEFNNYNKIIINNDNTIISDDTLYFINNSNKNNCTTLNVLKSLELKNKFKVNNIKIYNPYLGFNYKLIP